MGFAADPSGWGCKAVLPPSSSPCSGATFEKLGQTACAPVGDCGAAFPPAAATYFVSPSGPSDATHFTSITAALAAAPADATIAIGAGTYAEALTLSRGVKLIGVCAAQVTLQGSAVAAPGLAVSGTKGVEVQGLTITGFEVGVSITAGAAIEVRDAVIVANRRSGVFASDGGTKGRILRSAIRGNLPDATATFGHGVDVGQAADLDLEDSALVGNREMGVFVAKAGAHVHLARSVVRASLPRDSDGSYGWGIGVQSGGLLDADGSALEANQAAGLTVASAGSVATFTDGTIDGVALGRDSGGHSIAAGASAFLGAELTLTRATVASSDDTGVYAAQTSTLTVLDSVVRNSLSKIGKPIGGGVWAQDTAVANIQGTAIVDNAGLGLNALDQVKMTVTDTLVSGTRPIHFTGSGYGATVTGAAFTATRVAFVHNAGAGLQLHGKGSKATLDGAIIDDTQLALIDAVTRYGVGIAADDGTQIDLKNSVIRKSAAGGIFLAGAGASATLSGSLVRDTVPAGDGSGGFGIAAQEGATLTLDGVGLIANNRVGLFLADAGTSATVSNSVIRDTQADGGTRGRGVNVQMGATCDLHGTAILDNRQVGLFLFGDGTAATLADSLIAGTLPDADGTFGHGIEAIASAKVVVPGSVLSANHTVGLVFSTSGGTVSGSRIESNAIGVNVQDGSTLEERATVPTDVGATSVVISKDTKFVSNGSRVGNGLVPLPTPIGDDHR